MRTRLLRLTALSIGGLAALAGDLPRLGDGRSFAAGLSWISAAHADDADAGGGNGENGAGGSDQGGENVGSGGSNGTEGGGDWGTGDGSGSGGVPGGTGAGGGGGAIDGNSERHSSPPGIDGHSARHSLSRDTRDYGPSGNVWHGGSNFLNLFRQAPETRPERSRPESSSGQRTDAGSRKNAVQTRREP
ncbi:hypothetical protein BC374_12130 [Ensifer sp. LC13]|nr:hypothetical protein BC374_12130 [Ensifer sp. LC13]OCP28958.1 hypothetical protein BC364_10530 [Ensifer sp. LC499]